MIKSSTNSKCSKDLINWRLSQLWIPKPLLKPSRKRPSILRSPRIKTGNSRWEIIWTTRSSLMTKTRPYMICQLGSLYREARKWSDHKLKSPGSTSFYLRTIWTQPSRERLSSCRQSVDGKMLRLKKFRLLGLRTKCLKTSFAVIKRWSKKQKSISNKVFLWQL